MSVSVESHAGNPAHDFGPTRYPLDGARAGALGTSQSPLIHEAAAGNLEALTILLRQARPVIYRWASTRVQDPDEAEDVTQAVLIRLWSALPGFRGDSRLSSWIHRITVNEAAVHHRRRRARQNKNSEWATRLADPAPPGYEIRMDLESFGTAVRNLACALPPLQQAAFRLVDLDGLRPCDVARELGKTQTTVRSSLCRARRKIRELLGQSRRALGAP